MDTASQKPKAMAGIKKNSRDLTIGTPWKKIVLFALPMLIGNIFQQLYNIIDAIILGRFVGSTALAASGTAFPIIFLMVSLFMGIAMGSTILIAQYFGAKDSENMRKVAGTTYVFLFVGSILITIMGLTMSEGILHWLNTPADVFDQAKIFLDITFLGSISMFGYNTISGILRGIGNSKTPLYFLIIATFVNIALVMLFVIGFDWGVAGAAFATFAAQTVSFIISIVYINKHNPELGIKWQNLVFDFTVFKNIIAIGIPTGLQQMTVSIGLLLIQSMINSYGSDVLAGFTAASRIDSFAFMPIMSFSAAVSTFVGQNIGAQKMYRIEVGTKSSIKISVLYSIFSAALLLLLATPLLGLFDENPAAIAAGHDYLVRIVPFYFIIAVTFCYNGLMRGAGAAVVPLIVTIFSMILVRVPLAYILSQYMNSPNGIWWSVSIGWLMGLVIVYTYYKKGKWRGKSVIDKTKPQSI